jgi:hypothetical protein
MTPEKTGVLKVPVFLFSGAHSDRSVEGKCTRLVANYELKLKTHRKDAWPI